MRQRRSFPYSHRMQQSFALSSGTAIRLRHSLQPVAWTAMSFFGGSVCVTILLLTVGFDCWETIAKITRRETLPPENNSLQKVWLQPACLSCQCELLRKLLCHTFTNVSCPCLPASGRCAPGHLTPQSLF